MSKSVLISIRPKWCELIAACAKTIECRKSRPNLPCPFKVYIYETKAFHVFEFLRNLGCGELADRLMHGLGKVVGEFTCDRITSLSGRGIVSDELLGYACLSAEEYYAYRKGGTTYFWQISDPVIYDTPKSLDDFCTGRSVMWFDDNGEITYTGMETPPQSWCYVWAKEEL